MRFLTARWEHLVLLNYVCPAALLEPLVPAGTTLDRWDGDVLVSLVGFLFSDTRLLGVPVPRGMVIARGVAVSASTDRNSLNVAITAKIAVAASKERRAEARS